MKKAYIRILIFFIAFCSSVLIYSIDDNKNEVVDFGDYMRVNNNDDTSKKIGLVFRATATAATPGATVRYRTNGVNIDIYKDNSTYLGRKFVSFEDWHSITHGTLEKDIHLNQIIESPTMTQNLLLINDLKNVFDNHDTLLILNAQIEVFRTNAQGGYSQRITLANTLQEAINAAPWGQQTIEDFKTRYDQKRDFQAFKKVPYSITKTYWGVNESGAVKIKNDFVWKDTVHEDELPKILELCVLEHSVPSNISFNGINYTFESNNVSTNAGGIYNTQTETEDKKREIILTENNLHHWVRYKYIVAGETNITEDIPNDELPQSEAQGTIIFTPYSSEWVKGIDVLISLAEDAVTIVEASNSIDRNYNYRYINDNGDDDIGTSSVLRAYTQTWEAGEIKVEGQNKLNNENKSMNINSARKVTLQNDGIWVLNGALRGWNSSSKTWNDTMIPSNIPNGGTFLQWNSTSLPDTGRPTNLFNSNSGIYKIDNTPPEIKYNETGRVRFENGWNGYYYHPDNSISFNVSDNLSGINKVIYRWHSQGDQGEAVELDIKTSEGRATNEAIEIPVHQDKIRTGDWYLNVYVEDRAGNSFTLSNNRIRIICELYNFRITGIEDPSWRTFFHNSDGTSKGAELKVSDLPVGNRLDIKNTHIKKGYAFFFRFNSRGLNSFSGDVDRVEIKPRFYHTNDPSKGSDKRIDLYYNMGTTYLIKVGSDRDSLEIIYNKDKLGSLSLIDKFPMEAKDEIEGEWRGAYFIPSESIPVVKDKEPHIESNQLKGGYIIVEFVIEGIKNDQVVFKYVDKDIEADKWDEEGGVNAQNSEFFKGDIIIIDNRYSKRDDYKVQVDR
ncbi:UNVERIFIED_CONTAM: hypothetical protein Cloal_2181 [Acetivibrio alkalicellulosi]